MRLNKRTKSFLLSGMIGVMAAASAFPALAATGWTKVGDKQYYYFDNGQMATGLQNLNDTYYYFQSDGTMWTGWLKLDNDYYYMQNDGSLSTGWVNISNEWYYMRPDSGKCVLNEAMEIEGSWYFLKSDGKRLGGWLKKDGEFRYMDPADNGRMIINASKVIDGVTYSFGPNGVCSTAVQVTNYYDAGTVAASETTNNSSAETDNSGKSNVIVAGQNN